MAMNGAIFSTSEILDNSEPLDAEPSSVLDETGAEFATTETETADSDRSLRETLRAAWTGEDDAEELADGIDLAHSATIGIALSRAVIASSAGTEIARTEIASGLRSFVQGILPTNDTIVADKAVADEASRAEYALAVIPSDDLFPNQWHLLNTGQSGGDAGVDLNVTEVWDDYTGVGVNVGIWDDGVQYTHHDLDDNYDTGLHIVVGGVTHDPLPQSFQSAHGTSVAGVIAAENNDEGTVGVAYGATLGAVDMFFDGTLDFEASFYELDNFDVTNHSWGWVTPFVDSIYDTNSTGGVDWQSFFGGFFESVETGRGGLGTINMVANGNDREIGRDGNDSNFNSIPQTIAVGATSHDGYVSYYSTPGANLLISSPSNGAEGAGIWTTDRTGFWGYDRGGDYTSSFGGTSSATPAAAGVVALMLEANPELGWRDVQTILAYSARHTGSDIGDAPEADELYAWGFNGATNWNGGGLHFSNDYGFGLIDALAAVRLAETWTYQKTSANWEDPIVDSQSFNTVIPDNDPNGISFTFETTVDFDIEHVGLTLGFSGGYTGDYNIQLISPDGTSSTLAVTGNEGTAFTDNWFFMSNAFRGETSAGTWTVEISDETAGDTGTLTYGELQFFGETSTNSDIFVYTNEFSDYAGDGNHLLSLDDPSGGKHDILNVSAVTSDTYVDLLGAATIDGVDLTSVTGIEHVYAGDGDDLIRGSGQNNTIIGGRGNDLLLGRKGDDFLSDGEGQDILKGQGGYDTYELCIDDSRDSINGFEDGFDTILFSEGDLEFADLTISDINTGKVRIDYADDFVIVINTKDIISSADFDVSDFLFA